jgi:ribosomal protein S18 acetylase RimI-like enzyme
MTPTDSQLVYEVRAASQDDIAELARMRLALQTHFAQANFHLVALSSKREAALPTFYHDLITDSHARVLIVHDSLGTQRIGMAVGRIVRHEEFAPAVWGHIDDVWVEPAYRHLGICRTLIGQLLKFFEEAGIEVLVLDYVIGNTEAEGVWKRFGFQPVLTVANARVKEVQQYLKGNAP